MVISLAVVFPPFLLLLAFIILGTHTEHTNSGINFRNCKLVRTVFESKHTWITHS